VGRARAKKVRVTATLDSGIVEALDRAARRNGLASRSQALEMALGHWLRERKRDEIEWEIEAYYRSLPAEEKREDHEWARYASRAARRLKD
jgi:metal-responsive CopG/Arc/MetJ family transcriptional regulator